MPASRHPRFGLWLGLGAGLLARALAGDGLLGRVVGPALDLEPSGQSGSSPSTSIACELGLALRR